MRHNSETLARCGVCVPSSGTLNLESGHHRIAWEMRGDKRNQGNCHYIADLLRELQVCPHRKAVISSEDFEYLVRTPDRLLLFQQEMRAIGWNIVYAAYFREPWEYAVSLYYELLKHDVGVTFPDFFFQLYRRQSYTTPGGWFFDFNHPRLVSEWERVFGTPITSLSYDDAIHSDGILTPVLDLLGIDRRAPFPVPLRMANVRSPGSASVKKKLIRKTLGIALARASKTKWKSNI